MSLGGARLAGGQRPQMVSNRQRTGAKHFLLYLVVGAAFLLFTISTVPLQYVTHSPYYIERLPKTQPRTDVHYSDDDMQKNSAELESSRGGLNATVTLVRPLATASYLKEIVQWVDSVEHLADHVCILTETPTYFAWLRSALDDKLRPHLRGRVRLINVHLEFSHCKRSGNYSRGVCYPTSTSKQFSEGYKHMCRLWYSKVWSYLSEYDFILRFDIDNKYVQGVWPTGVRYFGTVACLKEDSAEVTVGLEDTIWGNLTQRSPRRYPYTNVMFANVKWAATNSALSDIFQRVEDTNCVCINRWGDLPLWGETLAKMGLRPEIMPGWKYFHGSHGNTVIVSDASLC